MTRRADDPFSRPLDHALERLRTHGLPHRGDTRHFHTWRAVCPSCRVPDWTLTLRERGYGGPIVIRCAVGCSETEVNDALAREPAEARIEAAEVREAHAWEIAEQLRTLLVRALELAADAQRELARTEPLGIAA